MEELKKIYFLHHYQKSLSTQNRNYIQHRKFFIFFRKANAGNIAVFGLFKFHHGFRFGIGFGAEDNHTMSNYHHSDQWSGGAWLTAGSKSAVIFVGTKGVGENCWYGFADGTVWPDEPPYPPIPDPPNDDRGWWSSGFEGQIIFYDPANLAAVARGDMESWEPQPYASLNIDPYLFNVQSNRQVSHVGAASFDHARGVLYIFEPLADGDKSLIHAWKVGG